MRYFNRSLVVSGVLLLAVASSPTIAAEQPTTGPVVEKFGAVYDVADPVHAADLKRGVKAVFDVGRGASESGAINPRIETVARFLNLHARAGFPKSKTKAAMVLHGAASEAALNDGAYRSRHGVANPDLELLAQLRAAGVKIYLCGQSAAHRGINSEELSTDVDIALSAMTVLVQLQSRGYQLIAF